MCDNCKAKLICSISSDNPSHEFIQRKQYESAKEGLFAPSRILSDVLQEIELEYRKIVEEVMIKEGVFGTLVSTIHKNVNLALICCNTCHVHKGVVYIMLKIRLNHYKIQIPPSRE